MHIRKIYARKSDKKTAISPPFEKSLFTLERARKYASRRNRRRAMSDLGTHFRLASGYASNFQRVDVDVEHIQKKRTPIRLEVAYAKTLIANVVYVYAIREIIVLKI